MRNFRGLIWLFPIVVAGACAGERTTSLQAPTRSRSRVLASKEAKKKPGVGLVLRLEEGSPPASAKPAPPAKAAPLGAAQTARLLSRLRPVKSEAGDQKAFALRKRSLPPPRTGKTITDAFPPKEKPPVPAPKEPGPLKVLRTAPSGDAQLAPNLSVTFSQPMVAVTSHAQSIAKGVPVRLTPAVGGKWRWVGTKTVLFEPKVRFPMATEFVAEVPAGTKSAVGGRLAEAKRWTFRTPPPRLLGRYPTGGPHRLDPVFFISFDQRVDANKVLKKLELRGDDRTFAVHLATSDDLLSHRKVAEMMKLAGKQRAVAFRSKELLPPSTSFTVAVKAGTPSLEGPRTTTKDQRFSFKTYEPLKIRRQSCREDLPCRPMRALSIYFNNPLDEEAIDTKTIRVDPPIQGQQIQVRYKRIAIVGMTRGRSTYRVTLPSSVADKFGQTLGESKTLRFYTREAAKMLFAPGGRHVVLDPAGAKKFSIYTVNHEELDLRLYSVEPRHWHQFLHFASRGMRKKVPDDPPGKLRLRRTIRPGGKADQMTETRVDLTEALDGGHGQVVLLVTHKPLAEKSWRRRFVTAWIQVTDLALDGFTDDLHMRGWVTRLKDGKPVKGARLSLLPEGDSSTTDATGLGRLPLPAAGGKTSRLLVASAGNDTVILPESEYSWLRYSSWRRSTVTDQMRWYVFDDRKLYKPKETVRLKGWARIINMGRGGGIKPLPPSVRSITFEARDPRGNKIANGTAPVGDLGGFDLSFKLPDTANLGRARVILRAKGAGVRQSTHSHSFKIQEFRRPEFEMKASASEGPHLVSGSAVFSATASYYAGGGLPGADINWSVSSRSGYFTPPKLGKYQFGGSGPSWWRIGPRRRSRTQRYKGKTDGKGTHHVRVHFDRIDPPQPMSVTAQATVQDVNRQTWSATSHLVVHPARHYVGLRTKRYFYKRKTPIKLEIVVSDLDGKLLAGRTVTVRAIRSHWTYQRGKWTQKEADAQNCKVVSKSEPVTCRFQTPKGGQYVLTARIKDNLGRPNRTVMTRWVSGGFLPTKRRVEREQVKLLSDRQTYRPGDTAEILVQSPFHPAEGLMSVARGGVLYTQRFHLDSPTATLKVPLKTEHLPGVTVQVDVVGSAHRLGPTGEPNPKLPRRPAFASGSLSLSIPPLERKLQLQAKPRRPKLEPGGKTVIDVSLKRADGTPVARGEVAVVVVDEAVLALTGYRIGSPLGLFYPWRGSGLSAYHMRPKVQLASLADLLKKGASLLPSEVKEEEKTKVMAQPAAAAAPGGGIGALARGIMTKKAQGFGTGKEKDKSAGADPIAVRTDFRALALFAAAVRTDGDGRAQLPIKVPDNLTRYRVMAIAVADEKYYGHSDETLTARMPLMVRPSAPRFLNFGDRFELPVVLQNQTDAEMRVQVAVRATNARLIAGAGRQIAVPANDRVEVRFPATADMAGTARFQFAAAAGRWTDAAEVSLPVWTPATTEAFATYGTIDKGAIVQPIQVPPNIFVQFGGLQVGTSSTALQALTDAVLYLVAYRFECSEQLSSRVLAVAALKDVLGAFEAPGLPPPEKILAAVKRDLRRLQGMQNDDGGFPFWTRGRRSWPFLSCHVTHSLVRAKEKGFPVPASMLRRAMSHLKNIERYIPSKYPQSVRRTIRAYSVYVRAKGGDADVSKAKSLYAEFSRSKEPPLEAVGWLYPVLSGKPEAAAEIKEIRRLLQNRVTETAAAAHFATSYKDGGHLLLHSKRRVDGLLLEGLIQDQPKSDLIPKIVRGLLAHRKRGRWGNTQENAWVLLGLDRYFNTYEKVTPNFVARAWLGDRFAGQHAFRGRTTERHVVNIPMKAVAGVGAKANLTLQKRGAGRLYYRIGMRYAPSDLKLPPSSHGFTVTRSYASVDDPNDVRRDKDGTWRVKAGARVRVKVTMLAPTRRYHVALVDPLPAGLEPQNAALRGTQAAPPSSTPRSSHGGGLWGRGRWGRGWRPYWSWWGPWYEHHNLRDERAEAFSSLVWAGVHTFEYVARATTPGTYVVPPPKAEEMYHPETFGRGPGDRLIVE